MSGSIINNLKGKFQLVITDIKILLLAIFFCPQKLFNFPHNIVNTKDVIWLQKPIIIQKYVTWTTRETMDGAGKKSKPDNRCFELLNFKYRSNQSYKEIQEWVGNFSLRPPKGGHTKRLDFCWFSKPLFKIYEAWKHPIWHAIWNP